MKELPHNSFTETTMNSSAEHQLTQTPPKNPFEIGIEDRLHLPSVSPTVFSVIETPNRPDKSFRWTIDNIAALCPADIDERVSLEHSGTKLDLELEKKAQEAINTFFSQSEIVPSPWLPANCNAVSIHNSMSFSSPCLSSTKYIKKTELPTATVDASTQTLLTLPFDFDIQKVLGDYMTYHSPQAKTQDTNNEEMQSSDEDSKDSLSMSGLRRKLFFSASTDSNARSGGSNLSPTVSPLKNTPNKRFISPSSMGSTQFSSSPITRIVGRSSISPPVNFSSPPVSPINSILPKIRCSSRKKECRTPDANTNISYDELSSVSFRSMISCGSVGKIYDVQRMDSSSCMKITLEGEMTSSFDGNMIAQSDAASPTANQLLYSNQLYSSDMECFPSCSSQDTGYHTNSLQTTNSESMRFSLVLHGSSATSHLGSQGNLMQNSVRLSNKPCGDCVSIPATKGIVTNQMSSCHLHSNHELKNDNEDLKKFSSAWRPTSLSLDCTMSIDQQ